MLANKLAIDVGPVCDLMDWLAGCIILSCRFQQSGTLHRVMLPRTWILKLSPIFKKLVEKPGSMAITSFTTLAETILMHLDSPEEQDHLVVPEKTFDYRGIYISRV